MKKPRPRDDDLLDDPDADLDISSDIKGIISALHSIRDKAQKDGQKRSEETIGSVALEIHAMIDDAKSKADKDRQNFLKSLLKISKECESSLKNEYSNLQAEYDRFSKDKAAALQSFKEKSFKLPAFIGVDLHPKAQFPLPCQHFQAPTESLTLPADSCPT
ncbi:hypothetical protein LUZ63_004351 [Rhynchospora breviuscula]|uniref:Uncharacterized protein n=1 Tax=Rhynchospora breviuscula TaxID=2022672 RepID=A0A9Q0D418_9POAL|nr:hypothetical protein LUZ63_004351 [Rhynchospora breviuscula]